MNDVTGRGNSGDNNSNALDMWSISNWSNVFVDRALGDERENIIMMSVYGRDMSVQSFLGALTVGADQGGLRDIQLENDNGQRRTFGFSQSDLEKQVSRITCGIYGNMAQCILHSKNAMTPDLVEGMGYVMMPLDTNGNTLFPELGNFQERVWDMVKLLSKLPLLDEWRDDLLALPMRQFESEKTPYNAELTKAGAIVRLEMFTGINMRGYKVKIVDDVEFVLSKLLRRGLLPVPQHIYDDAQNMEKLNRLEHQNASASPNMH